MKPAQFRASLMPPIAKILATFFLIIVLVACGSNSTAPAAPAGAGSNRAGNTQGDASFTLKLNQSHISGEVDSLRIQSLFGFQCPAIWIAHSSLAMGQLVLASDRTTYSPDEIAQMRAYAGFPGENFGGGNSFLSTGAKPPPTLRWVLGGSMAPIPGNVFTPCGGELDVTNIGSTPIQIPMVGVQLEEAPHQNTYQYRLVDMCSFVPLSDRRSDCPLGAGGGGSCDTYHVVLQLGLGEKNTIFSAVPHGYPGCGTLTILPGTQVFLYFEFDLAAQTPKSMVYSIMPMLTVITAQGRQTLSFPQWRSTLAFASANQFSCYGLQGTAFVVEQPPFDATSRCI